MKKYVFFLFLTFEVFAVSEPLVPEGWVEANSIEPVILTWVKVRPEKKITEVPTIQVHQYSLTPKFLKFVKENVDSDNCRNIEEGGWRQSWCLRKNFILVIMVRGESLELVETKEKIKSWVLTHD